MFSGREAHRLDQFDAGDAGCSGAVADEPGRLHVAAGDLQRVDQAGSGDDGGTVLVVVEDGDVHHLAQLLLDDEAFRCLDVLQIDAAEGRPEIAHRVDEGVRILRIDLEIDRIDIGEALEQHRLALHHRLGCKSTEIAKPEDGGAVRDHGDQIAARGIIERARRVLGDRLHRNCDARRIGERQVALRRHRLGRVDFQLARPSHRWNSSASSALTEGPAFSGFFDAAMIPSVPSQYASFCGAFGIKATLGASKAPSRKRVFLNAQL